MNARCTAQDIVSWYSLNLDPFKPHPVNVKLLRWPIVSLTCSILQCAKDKEPSIPLFSTSKASDSEEEKKCFVEFKGYVFDLEKEKEGYASLDRRTRARIEAFLEYTSMIVPFDSSSFHQPVNPNEGAVVMPSSNARKSFVSITKNGKTLLRQMSQSSGCNSCHHRQISKEELLTRLELYVRTIHRVRTADDECVLALEPVRAIKARTRSVVSAFVDSVGCVRSMSPVLTKLLTLMTKELLAVEIVGEDLVKVIRRIVSEYEHSTSFASLAFLSSPEVSAETCLTPLVLKYVRYLQSNSGALVSSCELERMLSKSLDPNLRRMFKTIEFQSIGHLLEVCQLRRSDLQSIQLAPNMDTIHNSVDEINQAIRDLQREVITVNGHVLPPVTSRHDLINLLSQTLNSSSLTSYPLKRKVKSKDRKMTRSDSCPSTLSKSKKGRKNTGDIVSSGNEGDSEGIGAMERRRNFQLSTIDMLTKRLLIAAGRTGVGGDAYFVVRDLFGGEDVEVVPSKALPSQMGGYHSGSIDIIVRLASITIKCHGSFDVYPKSLVGTCEPLIQIHTTTWETIHLQEIRGDYTSPGTPSKNDDTSISGDEGSVMIVQEKVTDKTGWRNLSIRPALYEKVQEWDTPS